MAFATEMRALDTPIDVIALLMKAAGCQEGAHRIRLAADAWPNWWS